MITISLCVNDANGSLTGRVEVIEFHTEDNPVDELLRVECDLSYQRDNRQVMVGNKKFTVGRYGKYVGSITFDACDVNEAIAAELANYLRDCNGDMTSGESDLFDLWYSNRRFMDKDFLEEDIVGSHA